MWVHRVKPVPAPATSRVCVPGEPKDGGTPVQPTHRHGRGCSLDSHVVNAPGLRVLLVAPVVAVAVSCAGGQPPAVQEDPVAESPPGSPTVTAEPEEPTPTPTPELPPMQRLALEVVDDTFSPLTAIGAPPGDDRLFVVQQSGLISIIDAGGQQHDSAFLGIDDRVLAGGIEQGLLGLAFHPDYANNGRFFVYYTNRQGQRQLSEFAVDTDDPDRAEPDSEQVLLQLDQPAGSVDIRHYGGDLNFGPDGYLWIASGDGADAQGQGQDPNTLFGVLLRIDVDSGDPYGIPPDNPFVDGGGAPEVWAYGLRNPWRFDIDDVEEMVYIGDVGLQEVEEINVVPASEGGHNFGWADTEGFQCRFKADCDPDDYTMPVVWYPNFLTVDPEASDHPHGCSVTGGVVYRGADIPELDGHYFYTDWCGDWVKSFRYTDGEVTEEQDWTEDLGDVSEMQCASARAAPCITSFATGGDGEMYAVTHSGYVVKFVAER